MEKKIKSKNRQIDIDTEKIVLEGLTFDDVLLLPAYSQFHPREVNITSKLTKNIQLNVPFLSAAMDTVTESNMGIALAREGGIGIIHKNMSIDQQAKQVRKVKRTENGLILDPLTLQEDALIEDVIRLINQYQIGGIPIVDKHHVLKGIVTNRDLRFEINYKKKVSDIMTKEHLVTAKVGTKLKDAEKILQQYKIEKLPIVDKNNKLMGLVTYRDILQQKNFPLSIKDKLGRLMVGAAVGITKDYMERTKMLVEAEVDIISLDSAHGHSKGVIDVLKSIRKEFPLLDIIAGNVATAEGAKALQLAGASAIKVGIGPGSICTTRIVTGVGIPQITAIMEVKKGLKGTHIPIIADGGIRYSGDVVKAIAAGANVVMMGSLFAGTEESPGETIIYNGRKYKQYRGMGSLGAMMAGSGDRYFQEENDNNIKKLVPEGIEGRVPYKGSLNETIYQFVGGLKSGMGYCGANTIVALQNAKFVKISIAGVHESHPHDIDITKEAPNYSS